MKQIVQLLFPKNNYDAIIPAVAGFFIIYGYTWHSGIGISPDSIMYLSTARNIHQYGAFNDFDGRPLVDFPIFYPTFLSFFIFITRLDPLQFAPILSGIIFAVVIYISGWIMEHFSIKKKWYKYIILSFLVFSPCLLEVYSMLWSETLFILIELLFFISFNHYAQTKSVKRLLVVSCIVGVACITRYAGITLIGSGCLLLLFDSELDFLKKLRNIFLYGFISSILLAVNLTRNILLSKTFTGPREKSITSFADNISHFGNVLCNWYPLPENNYAIAFVMGLIFLLVITFICLKLLFKKQDLNSYEKIISVFCFVYAWFMILSATFSRYETFSSRLLAPMFIPMLWQSSYILPWVTKKYSRKKRLWIAVRIAIIVLCFQANQLYIDDDNYDGIKDAGLPGYAEDSWNKDSQIVNFLRAHKNLFQPGYVLCSNAEEAVYFYTGLHCENIPHKVFSQQKDSFNAKSHIYLIWFNDIDNPELTQLNDALSHRKMAILYKFNNGTIYKDSN